MIRTIKLSLLFCILPFMLSSFSQNTLQENKKDQVIIIMGIQSSGKTTLVSKILKQDKQFKTIPRQKIMYKIWAQHYQDLFKEVKDLTGIEINGFLHLNSIMPDTLPSGTREKFIQLRKRYQDIIEERRDNYLKAIFAQYKDEINKNILSGVTTIIDEALIRTDEDYKLLLSYLDGINVKRLLLYSSLDDILKKCQSRNSKFYNSVDPTEDIEQSITKMEKDEVVTESSQNSFRFPYKIVIDYKGMYKFVTSKQKDSFILDTLVKSETRQVLEKINEEQQTLLEILGSNKNTKDTHYVENELRAIFGSADKVYVVSKMGFDYLIKTEEIDNLSKINLLAYFKSAINFEN